AAALVREEELHLYLTLCCGEVWRGLHNSYLGRQALGENGVDIDEGLLLLQEFGWIAVQFGNQEIGAIEAFIELLHRDVLRQSGLALVEAVADQARPLPVVRGSKKPFGGPRHPGSIAGGEEPEGGMEGRLARRREIRQRPQYQGLIDSTREGPASIARDG